MKIGDSIIIAPLRMKALARRLGNALGIPYYLVESAIFPDGEMEVSLDAPLYNSKVILLFETAPPHSHRKIFELQCIVNLLKTRGASTVHVIFTYMSYLRQGETEGAMGVLKSILKETTVSVVEPHRPSTLYHAISCTELISHSLKTIRDPLIIAPDEGAEQRVCAIASLLKADFLLFKKKRHLKDVSIAGDDVEKCHHRNCIFVDDILSTGKTLLSAHDLIKNYAPKSVTAVIVHNLAKPKTLEAIRTRGMHLVFCGYKVHSNDSLDITPALFGFLRKMLELPE